MSQRIKELVALAERDLHDITGQTWGIHPAIADKFAELVVQECIQVGIETGILDQDYNYPAFMKALEKRGLKGIY